jgi:hypothetical protein
MAQVWETKTDDVIGVLDKAMKTKPHDSKTRIDLQKKANTQLKDLQKLIADGSDTMTKSIEKVLRTAEEMLGVAESEVKLLDHHAIVGHLRHAVKLYKEYPKPKGWTDSYDKAAKTVAGWDPKGEKLDALRDGMKYLDLGKKTISAYFTGKRKIELACNHMFDKAIDDANHMKDQHVKAALQKYIDTIVGMFGPV